MEMCLEIVSFKMGVDSSFPCEKLLSEAIQRKATLIKRTSGVISAP